MSLAATEPETNAFNTQRKVQEPVVTDITAGDVQVMILYLRKARNRAIDIRDRSPAGSYLENVLSRTINGIALELKQLEYLLMSNPDALPRSQTGNARMRPAI